MCIACPEMTLRRSARTGGPKLNCPGVRVISVAQTRKAYGAALGRSAARLGRQRIFDSEVVRREPGSWQLPAQPGWPSCRAGGAGPCGNTVPPRPARRSGGDGPQRFLQSDTFHPTVKAWLFLDDVDDGNGPFTYVPGSHRLTWSRLKWEYRKSISWRDPPDPYSRKGSLRLTEGERRDFGLGEPVLYRVPRNTLVIANTHGFHRRGAAVEAASRLEIWVYSRSNPFNPVPGLDSRLLDKLRYRLFKMYLRYRNRQAEREGGPPSWRLTDWQVG